mgnify:CR=1 FL=1
MNGFRANGAGVGQRLIYRGLCLGFAARQGGKAVLADGGVAAVRVQAQHGKAGLLQRRAGVYARQQFQPLQQRRVVDQVPGDEVLHVALSDAFEREDRLSSLASAIREVRRASMQPQLQVLVSGRAFAMQPGLAVVVGADGDGLAQGSDAPDLEAMLAWARIRRQSPGMMVAQSMINGLAVSMQRKRFGASHWPLTIGGEATGDQLSTR